MSLGTIKKLLIDKHCGFISPSVGPDVFFHGSVVANGEFGVLRPGQRVEYEVDPEDPGAERGPRAARVRILGLEPVPSPQQGEFRQLKRHPASRAKKPTWRNKGK
jgi:cold shock CspA family protein